MSGTLRIVLAVCIVIYFLVVIKLLKNKRINLKYTLLWLLMGIIMLILVIFPDLLILLAGLLGIEDAMNGLFTFSIAFVILLMMMLTSIVSVQSEKIKKLVQESALLEKRIRELENQKSNVEGENGNFIETR